jgi:putative iron-only hydrogenase system regulator
VLKKPEVRVRLKTRGYMTEHEEIRVGDKRESGKNRIGIISIIIYDRNSSAKQINALLSEFGSIVIGRMGIPHESRHIYIISVIVEGSVEQIGALTGKLGMIPHVSVKSHVSKWEDDDFEQNSSQESTT